MQIAQNTAFVRMFYLGQASLTPVVQISKAGGAFTDPASGVTLATEVGQGWYKVNLQAADTDTLGCLAYAFGSGSESATFLDNVIVPIGTTDPWLASLPGAYTVGQAGEMVGRCLNLSGGILPTTANDTIAAAILDKANGCETAMTIRQALRIMLSALAGKLTIVGSTITIRNTPDTVSRIVATTDADGQRTAVTTNAS